MLQKWANSVPPYNVIVRKVGYIKFGILLIATPGTAITQLKNHKERLAIVLGVCQSEYNQKWIKYFVRDLPRRIKTLENLEPGISDMAFEAVQYSYNMRPDIANGLTQREETKRN